MRSPLARAVLLAALSCLGGTSIGCAAPADDSAPDDGSSASAIQGTASTANARAVRAAYLAAGDGDLDLVDYATLPANAKSTMAIEITNGHLVVASVATFAVKGKGRYTVVELTAGGTLEEGTTAIPHLRFFDARGALRLEGEVLPAAVSTTGKDQILWFVPILSADGGVDRSEALP